MHEMMMVLPPEPVEPVDFIAAFVKGTATTLSIKAGEDENAVPFGAVALFLRKTLHLSRQAQDKHTRKADEKRGVFSFS